MFEKKRKKKKTDSLKIIFHATDCIFDYPLVGNKRYQRFEKVFLNSFTLSAWT